MRLLEKYHSEIQAELKNDEDRLREMIPNSSSWEQFQLFKGQLYALIQVADFMQTKYDEYYQSVVAGTDDEDEE